MAKKSKVPAGWRQLYENDRSYYNGLRAATKAIFGEADRLGWSIQELALEANLARSTVRRLQDHTTRHPQFRTILYLAKAVGLSVSFLHGSSESKKRRAA